eukprot:365011-Chlamydomonas_euryale.AAC.18
MWPHISYPGGHSTHCSASPLTGLHPTGKRLLRIALAGTIAACSMQQSFCGGRAATCAPRNAAQPTLPRVAIGPRTATNGVAVGTRHGAGLPSRRVAARVTIESGSRAGLQKFVATGGWDGKSDEPGVQFETPEAAIQAMPQPQQGVLVAAIFGYIFALSAAGINYTDLSIYRDSAILPPLMGALFAAAGVGHFTIHDAFASMMPYQVSYAVAGCAAPPTCCSTMCMQLQACCDWPTCSFLRP